MASNLTLLEACRRMVGIKETPAGSNKTSIGAAYGWNGVPWCGMAVWFAFQLAAQRLDLRSVLTPNMASTVEIMAAGKRKKWWVTGRALQPCDIVCYHMPGGRKGVNHVGIVESVTPLGIWAFEGNTSGTGSQYNGGAFLRKFRPWSVILGGVRVPFADKLGVIDPSTGRPIGDTGQPPVVTQPPAPTPAANQFQDQLKAMIFFSYLEIDKAPAKQGDNRKDLVKIIQQGLINRAGATILVDGIFGEETKRWVRWFQGLNQLTVDGVVGRSTFSRLFPT